MTAKFYRTYNESHEGKIGYFYCEVINQSITRMINSFGTNLYWSTPTACNCETYDFTDQPEFLDSEIPLLVQDYELIELTKEDFETLWNKAQEQ